MAVHIRLIRNNIKRHIKRIVCGFLPAGHRTRSHYILYDFCEGVKAIWQIGFKPSSPSASARSRRS